MSVVAVIPARGGSKRIPDKNIRDFAGQPIIAYSIQAARRSGVFDRIILSTDSDRIAEVGKHYGAEVPFMRPAELSDDITATAPVVAHAARWLREHDEPVTEICCLYPTAPFVRPEDLKEGYRLLTEEKAEAAISVTSFPFPIFRALKVDGQGRLGMFWPEHEPTRSQDLPQSYHDAGQFYWLLVDSFLQQLKLYADFALPVILPRSQVQDIDTPEEWEMAEVLFEAQRRRRNEKKS